MNKRRKTQEEFEQEVEEQGGGEYEVLGEYINTNTDIKMLHKKCGTKYHTRPRNFLVGSRCPNCNLHKGGHRKTHERFEEEVDEYGGGDYKVLSRYKNTKTKVKMLHKVCGSVYEVKPEGFLAGNRCPICRNKKRGRRKKTTEEYRKEVTELTAGEYEVVGEYTGAKNKVKLMHNKCGKFWEVIPNAFLSQGVRCYHCARVEIGKTNRKTTEEFREEIREVSRGDIEVIGEYKGTKTHIEVKGNSCGHVWKARPKHLSEGTGCPICMESIGERKTRKYLENRDIKTERQKRFKGLRDRYKLSYDFYLPEKRVLIEYQGIQHYEPVEFFGGVEKYEDQKRKDRIKREFSEKEGYTLIEIPYTERTYEEIEKYLDNRLNITL